MLLILPNILSMTKVWLGRLNNYDNNLLSTTLASQKLIRGMCPRSVTCIYIGPLRIWSYLFLRTLLGAQCASLFFLLSVFFKRNRPLFPFIYFMSCSFVYLIVTAFYFIITTTIYIHNFILTIGYGGRTEEDRTNKLTVMVWRARGPRGMARSHCRSGVIVGLPYRSRHGG